MKLIFRILAFFMLFFFAFNGYTQTTKTWTGSTNNDFNTGTNWNPTGVPSAADSCVVSVSASTSITLSSPITVGALNMVVSGNNKTLELDVLSYLLTIEGNLHTKVSSGNTNSFVRLDCGASSGGVTVGRDAYFDDGGTRDAWVIADETNPGVLTFKGNVAFGALAKTSPAIEPHIVFDGTGTQTVTADNTSSYFLAEDLEIGNANNPTVILEGVTANGFGCYDGTVSINGTSILDLGDNTINRFSIGGAFTINAGATLKIGTTRTFPSNYSTYTLDATSNTYYDGTNQTIEAAIAYGNLYLEGSDTKTLNAAGTINGSLTVSDVTLDANASMDIQGNVTLNDATFLGGTATTHTVEGDWTNTGGTFTPETSTVEFDGATSNQIQNSTNSNLIYSQDFTTSDGWTTQTFSGNTWGTFEDATYAYTDNDRAARYAWHGSEEADSWIFSKGIDMTAGKTYTIKFYQRVGGSTYPEKLELKVGSSNDAASQTTSLLTLDPATNTTYTERTGANFVAPSTGTFYFGFHCFSDADMFYLIIDDVRVYEESEDPVSTAESFYDFTVNKTGGATVDLASIASISSGLTFTDGVINATTDYYPEFGTSATVDGTPSATAHVNGPVQKLTNSTTAFTFPVGDGTAYRPVKVEPASSDATTWTGKYNNSGYVSSTVQAPLQGVSEVEYWDLDRSGSANGKVTLWWDENSNITTENLVELYVAHYNSVDNQWEEAGSLDHAGNSSAGSVSSYGTWGDFSPFSIGSSNAEALPVTMTQFSINCQDESNTTLTWQTESEINSNYFDIEKSIDGDSWDVVGTVQGQGNSNVTHDYNWSDYKPYKRGVSYYRLKQVDFNGEFEIFGPLSSNCINEKNNQIEVYPNPTIGNLTISYSWFNDETEATLKLTDAMGRLVKERSITLANGMNYYEFDLSNQSRGVYFINVEVAGKGINLKRVEKQ